MPTIPVWKKSIAAFVAATSLAGVGGVVAVTSAAAATSMVATSSVNLRSGPGTSYSILAVVPGGATVSATGASTGGWVPVSYGGKSGYIAGNYLQSAPTGSTSVPAATGSATATGYVNVRTGPSTSYAIIDVAAPGQSVATTGTVSGSWTQVVWGSRAAWISSSYLTNASGTGTPLSSTLPAVTGQMRTTATVNLRTQGNGSASIYGTVPASTVVDVTGNTTSTYTQVVYAGRALWIYSSYLTSVTSSPSTPQTVSERQQKLLDFAYAQLGKAYVWGAEGPNAYDCSGFTMVAYRQVGITLPHYSGYQATMGTAVSKANMQPGDLIFWYTPVQHVSMYVGDGKMIHARGSAYGVVLQSVDEYAGWTPIVGIRRFL